MTEFTKEQKERFVYILNKAMRLINKGSSTRLGKPKYICIAIKEDSYDEDVRLLRKEISRRLEGHHCLEDWLVSKGIKEEAQSLYRLQQHRIKWMTLMIKEFSQ